MTSPHFTYETSFNVYTKLLSFLLSLSPSCRRRYYNLVYPNCKFPSVFGEMRRTALPHTTMNPDYGSNKNKTKKKNSGWLIMKTAVTFNNMSCIIQSMKCLNEKMQQQKLYNTSQNEMKLNNNNNNKDNKDNNDYCDGFLRHSRSRTCPAHRSTSRSSRLPPHTDDSNTQ
ncbi:unnamed protein product [Trypanosoma congolense IL3000]|uniref:WGS project CAEQ00000000 data, annotated contig 351 n=1 Tax=Trypanosoma congolense (strain IL3000) TaxID=1068625 RepID=F9WF55_TRYCI|nr:unnamed protein product [Trypanosoma congolense IL3000]